MSKFVAACLGLMTAGAATFAWGFGQHVDTSRVKFFGLQQQSEPCKTSSDRDLCELQMKAQQAIHAAEKKAEESPSVRNHKRVYLVRAEENHRIARHLCEKQYAISTAEQTVCLIQAKQAMLQERSDAKLVSINAKRESKMLRGLEHSAITTSYRSLLSFAPR